MSKLDKLCPDEQRILRNLPLIFRGARQLCESGLAEQLLLNWRRIVWAYTTQTAGLRQIASLNGDFQDFRLSGEDTLGEPLSWARYDTKSYFYYGSLPWNMSFQGLSNSPKKYYPVLSISLGTLLTDMIPGENSGPIVSVDLSGLSRAIGNRRDAATYAETNKLIPNDQLWKAFDKMAGTRQVLTYRSPWSFRPRLHDMISCIDFSKLNTSVRALKLERVDPALTKLIMDYVQLCREFEYFDIRCRPIKKKSTNCPKITATKVTMEKAEQHVLCANARGLLKACKIWSHQPKNREVKGIQSGMLDRIEAFIVRGLKTHIPTNGIVEDGIYEEQRYPCVRSHYTYRVVAPSTGLALAIGFNLPGVGESPEMVLQATIWLNGLVKGRTIAALTRAQSFWRESDAHQILHRSWKYKKSQTLHTDWTYTWSASLLTVDIESIISRDSRKLCSCLTTKLGPVDDFIAVSKRLKKHNER